MKAVAGSGKTSMSDELIAFQPRIDDPSKPRPSEKTDSVNSDVGTAKCCHVPRMSQSLRSTILTSLDLARLITSLGVIGRRACVLFFGLVEATAAGCRGQFLAVEGDRKAASDDGTINTLLRTGHH